jgi:hypothetical protein
MAAAVSLADEEGIDAADDDEVEGNSAATA